MRKLITEGILLLGANDKSQDSKKSLTPDSATKPKKPGDPGYEYSAQALVARVRRLRERYNKVAKDQAKLTPSIGKAVAQDLFAPNPNSTPSSPSVTDLTKGW